MRAPAIIVIGVVVFFAIVFALTWALYGGAVEPYPDLTSSPRYAESALEVVVEGRDETSLEIDARKRDRFAVIWS